MAAPLDEVHVRLEGIHCSLSLDIAILDIFPVVIPLAVNISFAKFAVLQF